MEVVKLGKITIDEPFLKYYALKQKYESRKTSKCPICGRGPLEFSIRNRVLTSVCVNNPKCTGNLEVPIPSFYTYDKLIEDVQARFDLSQDAILRKKYDLLFHYSKDTNIQSVRENYLRDKQKKESVHMAYHKTKMVHEHDLQDLYIQKEEFLDALKKPGVDLASIQTDLNDVLNHIHTMEYHVIGRAHVPYTPFLNMVPVQ